MCASQVRTHINRHVHSAFWVSSTCGVLADTCYDSRVIEDMQDDFGGHHSPTGAISCADYIIEHERYNLAEGSVFTNIQESLPDTPKDHSPSQDTSYLSLQTCCPHGRRTTRVHPTDELD